MNPGLDQLKEKMRSSWIAGDFGKIALFSADSAAEFVDRLNIPRGAKVLDVACGTGNLAIPAARKGAQVTGLDLAPNLLEQARRRAAGEGLTATFDEGDAEQLPYADAAFDVVMTMFGAMFAPRPELVARELTRVCRPGGTVAMANWTPTGFVGKMFSLSAKHVPPPPGIPAPVLWGDDAVVRERLGPLTSQIKTERRAASFDFPFSPREVVQYFRDYFGPTKTGFARLDEAGQATFARDMEALWRENNTGDEQHTIVAGEYLEVVATR
jgi:ubiquinone/menaquinone biosynthesis C-methylase UbiE